MSDLGDFANCLHDRHHACYVIQLGLGCEQFSLLFQQPPWNSLYSFQETTKPCPSVVVNFTQSTCTIPSMRFLQLWTFSQFLLSTSQDSSLTFWKSPWCSPWSLHSILDPTKQLHATSSPQRILYKHCGSLSFPNHLLLPWLQNGLHRCLYLTLSW